MADRFSIRSFLAAAQLNLGNGVVDEGLMRCQDRAQLELVGSVQLGALLAKLECVLTSGQGCVLREELAAQSIFFFHGR